MVVCSGHDLSAVGGAEAERGMPGGRPGLTLQAMAELTAKLTALGASQAAALLSQVRSRWPSQVDESDG
eukprot:3349834-Pyramimonas_sp.AAC.1